MLEADHSPLISIIIPFYEKRRDYLEEALTHISELDYENYETIVVSNIPLKLSRAKTKVILTDKCSQGEKNDIGIANANGSICAFIGDDVFPRQDWLRNAIKYFKDPMVAAVGGPGETPPNDNIMQKASGYVYSSFLGAGTFAFRYTAKKTREVDDLPATNLLVRKSVLQTVQGFGVNYRSGEDTYLCMKIVQSGYKILYAPDVVVYHHRRPLFRPHCKQVKNCGFFRGYFIKKFNDARKIIHFLPSAFLVGVVIATVLAVLNSMVAFLMLALFLSFVICTFITGFSLSRSFKVAMLVPFGILLTYLAYGFGFIQGLLTRDENKLTY